MSYTTASAEIIALKALEWLVGHDDLLMTFLGSTGAGLEDIKAGAKKPEFLGSVLDFILMDDEWVKEFCGVENLDFDVPYSARQSLPGGEIPNWT